MATRLIRLDPVDAAWYHLDRPVNETQVTGLVLTATPLSLARLRALIEQRLLPFARFRQRVVEYGFPVALPHWELDPDFDLDRHLHHVALPEPGDMPALFELVGDLVSTRLDHERPLWQVHLVDRVGQGSALVLRYHHCLADGTAMMALISRTCDREADAPPPPPPAPEAPAQPGNWLDPFVRPALHMVEQSSRVIDAVGRGVQQVTHPEQVLDQVRGVAVGVGTAVMAVIKPADPPSPLRGSLSGKRRVACSEPLPLEQFKAIGKATGTKVNDVLIAVTSGALRQYLLAAGVDPQRLPLRAIVPVDLRAPERALELGNAFGLTFLDLPVGVADPLERLARARAGMEAIKCSPEALVFLNLLALFGQTPKPVEDLASNLFSSKASVVLTNVVGPQQPLYLAGSRITRLSFFVPHPVSLGLGISLLSYNGEVVLGVISDAEVLAEPARISDRFASEVAALQARACEG
ncbi:MAG: wax ester/triacylglycerol synthase family O-acyltransferase [Chloroflexi bacterium]|nr:wax ester/triacylglycerol synthase family O-acyltransferase [Chloroflexota bacterium]